jgi:hypothetical protein
VGHRHVDHQFVGVAGLGLGFGFAHSPVVVVVDEFLGVDLNLVTVIVVVGDTC